MRGASLRGRVKTFLEVLLCRAGAASWQRRRHAGDTLVLAYHNIVPDGEAAIGDSSLHLPQRRFAAQLDLLARTHDVVTLGDVFAQASTRSRPRVVLTFDDACQGALVAGAAELEKRSMPATVFVAPAFVGGRAFWWDCLGGPAGEPLSAEMRHYALTKLQGKDTRVRQWAVEQGMRERDVPWHQRAATEAQLAGLRPDLFGLGSHTWSHPNATTLSADELLAELTRPLEWLRPRFRNTTAWLAYPYGLAGETAAAAARAAGYEGALCIEGGWLGNATTSRGRWLLPRLNVPSGLSLRGFELRTAGVTRR